MDKRSPFRRILTTLLLLIGIAAFGSASAAALYKWTDAEGNVHYSQSPPEGKSAQKMEIKSDAPESPNGQPANDGPPEGAGQDPEKVKARQKNCEIARQNLAVYKESNKVQKPDGSVVVLSDEMRQMKLEETQKLVEEYCQ